MRALWLGVKWPLTALGILLLLLLATLCFLLFTQAGSALLIHTASDVANKNVAALNIKTGAVRQLSSGLHIDRVSWTSDAIEITVDDLDIAWSRRCKRPVLLCIKLINVAKLTLEPRAGAPADRAQAAIKLPSINAPLPLSIEKLAVHAIDYGGANSSALLRNIRWQAEDVYWLWRTVHIGQSHLRNAQIEHRLAGKIELHGDYRLAFNNRLELRLEALDSPLKLDAKLRNNVTDLLFEVNLTQPSMARISGQLRPLASDLPFRLQLQANDISARQWLKTETGFSLHDLDLLLTGSPAAYKIAGQATIAQQDAYRESLQINAKGNSTELRIDNIRLGDDKAWLTLQGRIGWQDQFRGNIKLAAHDFSVQSLLDYPVDNFNGKASASFAIDSNNSTARYTFKTTRLQALLHEQAYTLSADVSAQWPQTIDIAELKLESKDNHLLGSARLPAMLLLGANDRDKFYRALQASRIDSRFNFNDLSVIGQNLQGRLAGTIRSRTVKGKTSTIDAAIKANNVQTPTLKLKGANAKLSIATTPDSSSNIDTTLQNLDYNGRNIARASAKLTGTLNRHSLLVNANGEDLTLDASVDGGLLEKGNKLLGWRGAVRSLTAQHEKLSPLALQNTTAVEWIAEPTKIALAPFCVTVEDAKLCSSAINYTAQNLDASLTLTNFDARQLQGLLPDNFSWSGMLEGTAALQIRPSQPPNMQASFAGSSGTVKTWNEEQTLELPYEKLVLNAVLQNERLVMDFLVDAASAGKAAVNMQLSGTRFDELNATVNISKFPLGLLQPFVPEAERFEAQLNADLIAVGPLAQPELSGLVKIKDGLVRLRNHNTEISGIAIDGNFERNKLLLDGQFNVGKSIATIDGFLTYDAGLTGQLNLKGDALHIKLKPIVDIYTDLDLQANIEKNLLTLSGSIHVPKGEITLRELPGSAVVLSPDVVFAGQPAAGEDASTWAVNTKLDISIARKLKFSGFGATAKLAGRLTVKQKNQNPTTASGSIDVIEGRYRKFGQRLDVRRGQLLFAGPLSKPDIDLEAIRTVDDTVVGLKVLGDARTPQITPFSEPALPDNDILFMLVSGRKPGAAAEDVDASKMVAQALLSSGIRGSSDSVTGAAEKLGITDFSIGTGDDTDLLLSGYLHPNIYVEYGVGLLEEGNAFKMRWDFAKRLALEFASGLQSSVDLIYSIKF